MHRSVIIKELQDQVTIGDRHYLLQVLRDEDHVVSNIYLMQYEDEVILKSC